MQHENPIMKKTFQIVAPASVAGLPATRTFTQDPADLANVPVGAIIVVQEMTDEEFAFHTTPKTT